MTYSRIIAALTLIAVSSTQSIVFAEDAGYIELGPFAPRIISKTVLSNPKIPLDAKFDPEVRVWYSERERKLRILSRLGSLAQEDTIVLEDALPDSPVRVVNDGFQSFSEVMRELDIPTEWGAVRVTSVPPGAAIEIDGDFFGFTPSVLPVRTGTRSITAKLKGLEAQSKEVSVGFREVSNASFRFDAERKHAVELRPIPVTVVCSVFGREVKEPGEIDLRAWLDYDAQVLRLVSRQNNSYDDVSLAREELPDTIALAATEPIETDGLLNLFGLFRLRRWASVQVTSIPSRGLISVDGQVWGSTPSSWSMSVKRYQFGIDKAGYVSEKREVEVQPRQDNPVHFDLKSE